MDIPIEFIHDSPLHFRIKIQTRNPASALALIPEKSLIPALFQIAACSYDSKAASALKNVLGLNSTVLAEMMIDREKLEAILKREGSEEKSSSRGDINRIV